MGSERRHTEPSLNPELSRKSASSRGRTEYARFSGRLHHDCSPVRFRSLLQAHGPAPVGGPALSPWPPLPAPRLTAPAPACGAPPTAARSESACLFQQQSQPLRMRQVEVCWWPADVGGVTTDWSRLTPFAMRTSLKADLGRARR